AANAGFIRNQTRARSQRAGRGWKQSCESLGQDWSWQWVPQLRWPSSVRGSASRANGEKCCRPSLRQESSRLFILRLFFGSPTRNLANANTSILSPICASPHYVLPVKNKGRGGALRRPDAAARRPYHHSDIIASRVLYSATNALRKSSNVPSSI